MSLTILVRAGHILVGLTNEPVGKTEEIGSSRECAMEADFQKNSPYDCGLGKHYILRRIRKHNATFNRARFGHLGTAPWGVICSFRSISLIVLSKSGNILRTGDNN